MTGHARMERLPSPGGLGEAQLRDTQKAFDSVAADYDGPRGNNELIQRMRGTMWKTIGDVLPSGSRLLDLGCGTGLDAVELARHGYEVVASDWSPAMVERTRMRATEEAVGSKVSAVHLGVQQLHQLGGRFDGVYSNFGPLNCAPDLRAVANECARLVRPGGSLVFSVMGRVCPWEVGHYAVRRRFGRAGIRFARGAQSVGMNGHTIWTYYYMPREFYAAFEQHFELAGYRALSLFLPPPYMVDRYRRRPAWYERLGRMDDRLGGLRWLRDMGDHFLIVMHRR
ncbi:SAM-dependent methyltransferase [Luteibacter jiangsuensis]|uniref:SAM-dependent methyltransferase n=2 Tax=Luteibacter jiangsuensis TaxID=637577 RepID=A0ABT9T0K0_9GAMM|nr:SAM-dependent methyltransferase [Luteibacter jiangsuensis]